MYFTPFRKQFILHKLSHTKKNSLLEDWTSTQLGEYQLLNHPDLELTYSRTEDLEVYLLGFLLDWRNPGFSNKEIINDLIGKCSGSKEFIESSFDFFGQFVIILKEKDEISIFNDAAGTRSIFYKTDFSAVASTTKLLSLFTDLHLDTSAEAQEFYSHKKFLHRNKRYTIGDVTQFTDAKTLLANHKLQLKDNCIKRYFPTQKLDGVEKDYAASEINKRLDGHTEALKHRFDCEMLISAGLDSRILIPFGIKYNIPFVNYYKTYEGEEFYDTAIPKQILKNKGIGLNCEKWDISAEVDKQYSELVQESVDFPRTTAIDQTYTVNCLGRRRGKLLIFGHGGEFGRNSMGIYPSLSSDDMAQIAGYRNLPYARKVYKEWHQKAVPLKEKFNYTLMENFYWEQFFSIWSSKGLNERSIVADYYAFFNSRKVFEIMLSTPTRDRNPVSFKLLSEMVSQLDKSLLEYPINPTPKIKAKNLRYKLGVEFLWDNLKFKLRKYKEISL